MFIQTETTPNPSTLKFLPNEPVLREGVREFRDREDAEAVSPLAARLFGVDGVTGVFLAADFISVTKGEGDWQKLKPQVLGAIMEHYMSGEPVLSAAGGSEEADGEFAPEHAEIVSTIKELIDTRIRPAVANDGGDIIFHSFHDGTVYLKMRGACSGCPSSTATLRMGIENLLKHFVPEVKEVQPV
jgi:Fe-S cluster biogenesis protein NfuA